MNKRHYRRAAVLIAAAACLAVPATAGAASPLKGWWPMNERSGQTVYDWSGNGNNGTLGLTADLDDADPTWIKGIFNLGSALRFDGNDVVRIPESAALRPAHPTVSAWVRSDGGPGTFKYVISQGGDDCVAASYALYTTEHGKLAFYVYDGTGSTGFYRSPEADLSLWDGKWHHVAGTYDGATVRLFVDGRQVDTGTPASVAISYSLPSEGAFGGYSGPCSLFLAGDIDGVSIWDRALPIGDIGDLIRALIGGR